VNRATVYVLIALSSVFTGGYVSAQTTSSAAPDNSKSNRSDTTNTTATADSQSNKASDVDLTKRIRQSLTADHTLSTYAHNVKIVSNNGNVTLNGVVRTEEERGAIEAKAQEIAGKQNVTNRLKLASSK
jgi:hyperosmotically inducible protein